jgi:hypothetical protein
VGERQGEWRLEVGAVEGRGGREEKKGSYCAEANELVRRVIALTQRSKWFELELAMPRQSANDAIVSSSRFSSFFLL